MALPADPSKLQLGAYHANYFDLEEQRRKDSVANRMWQLQDTYDPDADHIIFSI